MRTLARVEPGGKYKQDETALVAAFAAPKTRRSAASGGVAEDQKGIAAGTIHRMRQYFVLDDDTGAPVTKNDGAGFAEHGGAGAAKGAGAAC